MTAQCTSAPGGEVRPAGGFNRRPVSRGPRHAENNMHCSCSGGDGTRRGGIDRCRKRGSGSARGRSGSNGSGRGGVAMHATALLLALAVFFGQGAVRTNAAITIRETGSSYASTQDPDLGLTLNDRYYYFGRLQVLEDNPSLCPPSDSPPDRRYQVQTPAEDTYVALMTHGGGCSLEDKAKFVKEYVTPKFLVKYIVVADSRHVSDAQKDRDDHDDDDDVVDDDGGVDEDSLAVLRRIDRLESELGRLDYRVRISGDGNDTEPFFFPDEERPESDDDDDSYIHRLFSPIAIASRTLRRHHHHTNKRDTEKEVPFYIVHISYRSERKLLSYLDNQSSDSKLQGGPRIIIESRKGGSNSLSPIATVWVGISALMGACACTGLVVLGCCTDDHEAANRRRMQQEQQQNQQPRRQPRRRLTRDQIKNFLPVYRYDGHELRLANASAERQQQAKASQGGGETEGLLPTSEHGSGGEDEAPEFPLTLPGPPDTELCSICLDEYSVGDRMRSLPCRHYFHSRCIGKWLAERSATCPLCKIELFEEEEEDDEEEEGEAEAATGDNNANGNAGEPTTAEPAANDNEQQPITEESRGMRLLRFLSRGRQIAAPDSDQARQRQQPADGTPTEALDNVPAVELVAGTNNSRDGDGEEEEDGGGDRYTAPWWRRMFPAIATAAGAFQESPASAVEQSAASMLSEPLLSGQPQQEDDGRQDADAPEPTAAQDDAVGVEV